MRSEKLGYTRMGMVALWFVFGTGFTWLALQLIHVNGAVIPELPLVAAIVMFVLAVFVLALAWAKRRNRDMAPNMAIVLLALGRAAVLAGAGLAGMYAAFGLFSLDRAYAALPQERLIVASIAFGASLLLIAGGYLLQRSLKAKNEE